MEGASKRRIYVLLQLESGTNQNGVRDRKQRKIYTMSSVHQTILLPAVTDLDSLAFKAVQRPWHLETRTIM